MTSRRTTDSWPAAMLLDDLLDRYVDWRENARAVAAAYRRWSSAPEPERAIRFAAYTATLDQEQQTAEAYAETVTYIERWLGCSDSRRARDAQVQPVEDTSPTRR